jgi:hypothetical protein
MQSRLCFVRRAPAICAGTTCGTRPRAFLQALGLPPMATMEVLGHASPDVTMGIYGHVLSASRRQAAELMDSYLDELEQPSGGITRGVPGVTSQSLGCQLAVRGLNEGARARMSVLILNSIWREATTGFEPVIAVLQSQVRV